MKESVAQNAISPNTFETQAAANLANEKYGDIRNLLSSNPLGTQILSDQEQLVETKILTEIDPLTGLLNRRGLERALIQSIALAKRGNTPLSLIYIDVDGLKKMNDTHGHQAGDLLLKTVAKIIKLRESDIVGRLGKSSDEMIIILPDTDSEAIDKQGISMAETLTQRLRQSAENNPFDHPSITDHQTHQSVANFSVGFAALSAEDTPETLINRADLTMQLDKRKRKQFNPSLPVRN